MAGEVSDSWRKSNFTPSPEQFCRVTHPSDNRDDPVGGNNNSIIFEVSEFAGY